MILTLIIGNINRVVIVKAAYLSKLVIELKHARFVGSLSLTQIKIRYIGIEGVVKIASHGIQRKIFAMLMTSNCIWYSNCCRASINFKQDTGFVILCTLQVN